ncbi:MAG: DUF4437 domain-containing protein [Planctomycetota bacterium]
MRIQLGLALLLCSCGTIPSALNEPFIMEAAGKTVRFSEVDWAPLNPARGAKGPRAGALWGDRTGAGPSGFLVAFVDGFESPPHIHNVSYRGVVLDGLVHNDDPNADEMWMPKGSYWTQPKGAVHITAGRGLPCLTYIEIEEGPYLVQPVEEAFESGEAPINVAPSNLVWLEQPHGSFSGVEVAYLWGEPRGNSGCGALYRLPAGFAGTMQCEGTSFRAVVIQGQVQLEAPGADEGPRLDPGSFFSSRGASPVGLACGGEVQLYVRSQGGVMVTQ